MTQRLFKTFCPACEERAITKAAGTEDVQVLVVGCEHNLVAATLIVDAGLILNWSVWPAPDVEVFARGAASQSEALQPLLSGYDSAKLLRH